MQLSCKNKLSTIYYEIRISYRKAFMSKYEYTAYIGRFRPFHNQHFKMLSHALTLGKKVIVVIGSAYSALTPKNPFTADQVKELIKTYFSEEDFSRIVFVEQIDLYDKALWVKNVTQKIKKISKNSSCALVTYVKDITGDYQKAFKSFAIEPHETEDETVNATAIRKALFEDAQSKEEKLEKLAAFVSEGSKEWLSSWLDSAVAAYLTREYAYYENYKQPFAALPYPPTFNTSDALIVCKHKGVYKALFIIRDRAPGKGTLAIPGGFLEAHQTSMQASIDEVEQETGFKLKGNKLKKLYKGNILLDDPLRSLRGRVVSVLHVYNLGTLKTLPVVKGADDAAMAMWLNIRDVAKTPERFFEDHYSAVKKGIKAFITTKISFVE